MKGKTKSIEFTEFQKERRDVYMYFTEPNDLVLEDGQSTAIYVFMSSIDVNEAPARSEFDLAMQLIASNRYEELYRLHAEKFANLWSIGRIETDNLEIQRVIFASYYYLLSSLPAYQHYGELNQFYGLSPGSLSRGALLQDYQGHSFWDTGNLIQV